MTQATVYKPLLLFHLAACSLMYAGFFCSVEQDWLHLILLTLCTFLGIFFVYRFNDYVDQTIGFHMNLRHFFSVRSHLFLLVFFFMIILPLSILSMNPFTFMVLGLSGILGILYSVNFVWFNYAFRIKHIFILKNLAIGLAWASLVLVGANTPNVAFANALFFFVGIQVFIGSAIRDFLDIEKDQRDGVNSLPVVLGFRPAVYVLIILNGLSFFTYLMVPNNQAFLWLSGIIVFWRFINLIGVYRSLNLKAWTQSRNLLTCFFIFIIVLSQYLYEYYS